MNRVMRNYTPDLMASRKSTIGASVSFTTPTLLGSASRRRYSVATTPSSDAIMSVSISSDRENVPPVNPSIRKSLSQNASTPGKRMSFHENLMLKILSTPVDQPLSLNDSDSSEISFCSSIVTTPHAEELIDSDDVLRCATPPCVGDNQNPRLARLYKDLQSPSATTRVRALRALKSPSKRDAYGQFDVPHEEQDIITADERKSPKPKTIQEIMSGVCIYVEVRSGADNRSDGIKDHVASLGAKVNDRMYRDTTHVIFKDGLLSTYQKAKKMNIPVVSILWIEACKRHMCLMNPEDFPISNQERYENPELFKKIRRQKSMQPRAEEVMNSGGKKRSALIPVNANNAAAGSKNVISPPGKLPVLHRIRKDDGLERILNEFQAENQNTPEPQDDFDKLLVGPMKLLERFRNSPTVIQTVGDTEVSSSSKEKEIGSTPEVPRRSVRKSLFDKKVEQQPGSNEKSARRRSSSSSSKEIAPKPTPASMRQRRKTTLFTPRVTSVTEESESPAPSAPASQEKSVRTRRRTMQISMKENSPLKKQETICSPKAMELCKTNSVTSNSVQQSSSLNHRARKTIYQPSTMEQSTDKTEKIANVEVTNKRNTPTNVINNSRKTKTPELDSKTLEAFRTNRRRTLYTPGVYDETDKQRNNDANGNSSLFTPVASSTANSKTPLAVNSLSRRKTMFTPSASVDNLHTPPQNADLLKTPGSMVQMRSKTLLEEYQSNLTFSSSRTPVSERRKTIFDISMDIIDKRLSHINKRAESANETAANVSRANSAEFALKSPPPKPSSLSRQTSLDTFYRKLSKSTEKTVIYNKTAISSENVINTVPRKRKLFNAQPSITGTPPSSSQSSTDTPVEENPNKRAKIPAETSPAASKTPASSRRRSLAPALSQPVKSVTTKCIQTSTRRSTMLFETARTSCSNSGHTRSQPVIATARPVMGTQARTMKALGLGAGLPTITASQQRATVTGKAAPFHLATTNLHAAQYGFVKETVAALGGFIVNNNVSDRTTHLVTLGPRRTINILRALVRGLWIVQYEWMEESARSGHWLPEEQFELRDFSAAVQICRSERQAFGSRYRMELFADCGPFYVSPNCEVPQDQLRELIITCKGKITGNAQKAKYLIVQSRQDVHNIPSGASCLSPLWLLDSISINKLKKINKYVVKQ
ncbi:uncharacterized protein LOC131438265 [Malaya genurostris]|uniref:uncharacterized protein LOC131438265 n=1 Tax=Malaya genurostris TaxID=325434 RepID=UPI0026F3A89D|nr:uncharacterized protein LOC131438265 [Malaya genurostris]